ncbi:MULTISPECIES: hypothetical protein [unclassified Pseudoalteromonas]|uniref:hypothetical protein n=1 Tax=unclassified Pseudoalteromonas TaxID=194690 RepID=UPI001109C3FC|nr:MULTISPECIES: hypothetical protein [unclassified Pseudoalteromonas]TMN80777.1 hypothetical protein CWB64_12905 [Pseudoalteromonas sp. S410]TMN89846.1 hypothetical protein CWB62_12425 [Pseudoalteromonas sp. S408]TMN97741.1 hypothetical protein CWB61_09240 [Pseudoalteromonas sp. S407]TMO02212.1 hypothetical protein CWB63_02055 [Pseudoalteromonas sp. S409]TMO14479.1 hypothetical protein CWB56_13305 [Pseudoalteromonas sp. S185]
MMVSIAEPFGIFTTWLFVFTFLYNLSAAINKTDNSRTYLSFIMMVSYTLCLYIDMYTPLRHLQLFIFDAVTIAAIIIWRFSLGRVIPVSFYYLVGGLSVNATLFLAMHVDFIVNPYCGYWWLWGVYGSVMPLVDITMAVVLVTNKDLLKLVWLTKKLTTHV